MVRPVAIVDIVKTEEIFPEVHKRDEIENLSSCHLAKGDKICLDFGDHQVGYVTLKLNSVGSPQDSPAFFRLKFGEIAKEMTEDSKIMTDGSAVDGFRRNLSISMSFRQN